MILELIDRMERNGFTMEIQINPIYEDPDLGITAKELPRALKTVLSVEELRPVLEKLLPAFKEEHRFKIFKAVQKLEARKSDTYMYDE